MTRSHLKRLKALLGAILFLLSTAGEGFGLAPCPFDAEGGESHRSHHAPSARTSQPAAADDRGTHPGHPASADDETRASPAPAGEGSHADHAYHADPAGPAGSAELCPHMEICQAATGATMPGGVDTSTIAAAPTIIPLGVVATERRTAVHPPFFLPLAQAPPAHG